MDKTGITDVLLDECQMIQDKSKENQVYQRNLHKNYVYYYEQWRTYDYYMAFSAMIGLVI